MSERRQSWHLWIGLTIWLAAAGNVFWFRHWLSLVQQMILWAMLLIGLTLVTRTFWKGILSPLFVYDVVRTGRRNRHIPPRCLYACLLLAVICMLFSNWFPMLWNQWPSLFSPSSLPQDRLAHFAASFFATFLAAQLLVVFLLTPIYIAGAIAEEKERRTLDYLLVTDLSDREIIFGILGSRLANLSLLILTGLPILMLIQFLGGVDAGLILAGFIVTAMTMLGLGSLSMAVSASTKNSTVAIFVTYAFSAFFFAFSACLPGLGNPLRVFLFGMIDASATTSVEATEVVVMVIISVLIHGFFSLVCLVIATNQLRPTAQDVGALAVGPASVWIPRPVARTTDGGGQSPAKKPKVLSTVSQEGWGPEEPAPPWLREVIAAGTYAESRNRPRVSDPPMLWKEFYRKRGANPLLALYLVGMIALFFMALFAGAASQSPNQSLRAWGAAITCLVLVVIPIGIAGAITREREQQTLDNLLVTPLERREILYGKWLGNILIVRWPLMFLAFGYGPAALAGEIHWVAWPVLVTAWFVYAGFLASLGLFLSTVCSTTLRATLLTVLITLGLGFSPAVEPVYPNTSAADRLLRNIQRHGLSPPRTLATLAFNGQESRDTHGEIQAALIGVLIYAGAAILLWEFSLVGLQRRKGAGAPNWWRAKSIANDLSLAPSLRISKAVAKKTG